MNLRFNALALAIALTGIFSVSAANAGGSSYQDHACGCHKPTDPASPADVQMANAANAAATANAAANQAQGQAQQAVGLGGQAFSGSLSASQGGAGGNATNGAVTLTSGPTSVATGPVSTGPATATATLGGVTTGPVSQSGGDQTVNLTVGTTAAAMQQPIVAGPVYTTRTLVLAPLPGHQATTAPASAPGVGTTHTGQCKPNASEDGKYSWIVQHDDPANPITVVIGSKEYTGVVYHAVLHGTMVHVGFGANSEADSQSVSGGVGVSLVQGALGTSKASSGSKIGWQNSGFQFCEHSQKIRMTNPVTLPPVNSTVPSPPVVQHEIERTPLVRQFVPCPKGGCRAPKSGYYTIKPGVTTITRGFGPLPTMSVK